MTPSSKEILTSIKNTVKCIDPDAQVVLYGSRARGDFKLFSDWDLLVLTSYEPNITDEQRYRHALFELELLYGEAFSTMVCSKSSWDSRYKVTPLYDSIKQEGIYV